MPTSSSNGWKKKKTSEPIDNQELTMKEPLMNLSKACGRMAVLAVLLTGVAACGAETKVTRVDTGVVTDLSGRWNDTDSRIVAESMVKEALEYPRLNNFSQSKRRQPVVVVGTVLNNSHEHINVQTFVTDLERELTNSQKVTFVAGKNEREEVRTERKEQAMYAREDTQKAPGKELGADYMMKGTIATILDEADGIKAMFYQGDLQMVDLENNAKVWFGQKKIKKVIEKKRTIF
jgi:penicillin-binding protein activator